MSDDRKKLKALLLSEEIAQIQALQKLLDDKQALSQKISEVLDPAIDLTIAQNPKFQQKFSKIDPNSYVRAIKANKQTFIDALLPIIGPMIRKSVSSAIRRFVSDVNRAVELGVSYKALKWRWKAFRTGIPFAEIVFNNTIEYQVQQVFLIDNHTGLLISHAGHEASLLQDKDAMSAMLTAIQDFVKDSVSAEGEGLSAAEIDDDILWIIPGNKAKIAATIKGAPTQRLRERMLTASEDIHIEFHKELGAESYWGNSPDLDTELEKLLLTKSQSDDEKEQKSTNYWPWIILLGGLLLWWIWSSYQHHKKQQDLMEQLNSTPGFVLQSLEYEDNQFIAKGLQDPLAEVNVTQENFTLESTPFLSLDDPIIQKRVQKIFTGKDIKVTVNNRITTLTGSTDDLVSYQNLLSIIKHQPGLSQVIDEVKHEPKLSLDTYLKNNNIPKGITIRTLNNDIILEGVSTQEDLNTLLNELGEFGAIDSEAVTVVAPEILKLFISNSPLTTINPNNLSSTAEQHLNDINEAFSQLQLLEDNVTIKLIAQSDCQGSIEASNEYSRIRLKLVQDYLLTHGKSNNEILTEVIDCTVISEAIDQSQIGVWFEVIQ